ncbi:hypothetical protein Golob_005589 [Gossypium lobatum]|uniref:UDP N-acetylglucosamine O-acyltransferase C-terminal domain-containing protein n=1 Tax=Gossypium lobatum TaxID=34289 RepID=A0A7J8MU07_9ROSI|nr:hypothetical protein [Gossypium lobatum]
MHPSSHIFGNTELGSHCVLMTGAVVGDDLPGHTVIGCNNIIGHHAVVGIKCQDMKYKLGDECFLDVGDNNEIREFTSIHRSSKSRDRTVIGDNNLIMGSCHIAHDCKIGNNNIFANTTLLAGHVIVEDYVHTGGATVVHQFCYIGSFSFIGGGSVVSQDVPKYMMVSGDRAELRGLNFEGLRRCGFQVTEIKSLRTAYRKIFMPSNTNSMGFDERLYEVVLPLSLNIMKIWAAFLLYVPCSSPFVILLLKIVVEYANSDNGAVLESIAGHFQAMYSICGMYQREPIQEALACFIKAAIGLTYVTRTGERVAYTNVSNTCILNSLSSIFIFVEDRHLLLMSECVGHEYYKGNEDSG